MSCASGDCVRRTAPCSTDSQWIRLQRATTFAALELRARRSRGTVIRGARAGIGWPARRRVRLSADRRRVRRSSATARASRHLATRHRREPTTSEWRIADQERLSAVENLYRLSINPTKQFTARDFTSRPEDLELTLIEGSVFASTPIRASPVSSCSAAANCGSARRRRPRRDRSGSSPAPRRSSRGSTRRTSASARSTLARRSQRSSCERPVDPRELRRAEQIFREESAKSFTLDLGDLSATPGRSCRAPAISWPRCARAASTR